MNTLQERLKRLMIDSQERCKFVENPDEFIKNRIEHAKKTYDSARQSLHKRWFETNKSFQKRLEAFDESWNEAIKSHTNYLKELTNKALTPVYVYYKGTKTLVPDSFYSSFYEADTVTFLEYLEEEDQKRNIITDDDREKARLLNCDVNYNYLQALINKMTNVPDLVITIKHKTDMTGVFRRTGSEEADNDLTNNELIIERLMVK